MKPMILVTTAAGKTGFATAMRLLEKHYPVRAFVHRHSPRAEMLKAAGAEIMIGDMLDIRDVRKALDGVQRAYYCAPFAPNHLHASMLFAAAANESRLEVLTKMTQWFAQPAHPSFFTREHWLTDQIMPLLPHTDVITINPGIFADFYLMSLGMVAQLGLLAMPLGQGANAPPSNEDIARVAVGALINPTPYIGKSFRPTGPRLLTPDDIAAILARVLGRKVKYKDVPLKMFLKAAKVQGFPFFEISQAYYYLQEHQRATLGVNAPNDVVREIGGREPEAFDSIARRYAALSPDAVRSPTNTLKALGLFARMILTPAADMARYEREQHHPVLNKPEFSAQSEYWLKTHDPRRQSVIAVRRDRA